MTTAFADSHTGHRRSHNEDCFGTDPASGLWLVADGVGGHANGEVAAAIVKDTIVRDAGQGVELSDAILHAHEEILKEIDKRPACNMGSTVVALQLDGYHYKIVWVGDSRAYLFDGVTLRQLTQDHNPVSEMVASGHLSAEQAASHPERNVLSRSLGVSNLLSARPEQITGRFHRGDQFLLCSDGLTDELDDAQIRAILRDNPSPQSQVERLMSAALNAGGRDNVTVVVVGEKKQGKSLSWRLTVAGLASALILALLWFFL